MNNALIKNFNSNMSSDIDSANIIIMLNVICYNKINERWSLQHIIKTSKFLLNGIINDDAIYEYVKNMRLPDHNSMCGYPHGYRLPELKYKNNSHYEFESTQGIIPLQSVMSPLPLIRHHKCTTYII